jgi:hypothetical protein
MVNISSFPTMIPFNITILFGVPFPLKSREENGAHPVDRSSGKIPLGKP